MLTVIVTPFDEKQSLKIWRRVLFGGFLWRKKDISSVETKVIGGFGTEDPFVLNHPLTPT